MSLNDDKTSPTMAKSKPAASQKKAKRKKVPIHTAIEPEHGDALEAYRKAQRYYPDLKVVIEDALKRFLEKEGFPVAQRDNSADSE